ncbi:nuclear autoantigenic sperm protein-like isoform X2 [Paramormyrops kingsleyae]|uniref:nuclear autoantigenic sperm protein-like isoform X2 n=1 Tax=Paramormyrops kingsleyae TaxID=1676925 RepID=UPI000CD6108B|nr:histone-binding protein N1/N2-like isoform X2 [Paramormyrops kingsleyae]
MPEDTPATSGPERMDEKPCSSSHAADSDVTEEAKKLLGAGNRHLVMGDVVSAVSVFQEACAMLAEKYGDTADECGEAFFLCGKALLELARIENTVLGNALEGVPEEDGDEEDKIDGSRIESADNLDERTRDELRVLVYDAMAEKDRTEGKTEPTEEQGVDAAAEERSAGRTANGTEEGCVSSGLVEKTESGVVDTEAQDLKGSEVSAVEVETSPLSAGAEEEEEEEAQEDEDGDEEGSTADAKESEEEVGNLQLAWEMLEVAKVIYKRKEDKEDQLKAAQAYLKLGEVGVESGNYSQALQDFQQCLELQQKYLPPHSRLLAETHYQLGVTFSYACQYLQAVQHFSSSVKVIEHRMALLQEVIDKAEGADVAEEKEMEELIQLLPDIKEKIEDAQESQRSGGVASEVIHQTLAGASTSGISSSSDAASSLDSKKPSDGANAKPVSDISHLVRKKPEKQSTTVEASV